MGGGGSEGVVGGVRQGGEAGGEAGAVGSVSLMEGGREYQESRSRAGAVRRNESRARDSDLGGGGQVRYAAEPGRDAPPATAPGHGSFGAAAGGGWGGARTPIRHSVSAEPAELTRTQVRSSGRGMGMVGGAAQHWEGGDARQPLLALVISRDYY